MSLHEACDKGIPFLSLAPFTAYIGEPCCHCCEVTMGLFEMQSKSLQTYQPHHLP